MVNKKAPKAFLEKKKKTGSRPITEVKPCRAGLVLGWVTAWEYHVL